MDNDLTNKSVAKLFSGEVMLSIIATIFMVGVTWQSLAQKVDDTDGKVDKLEGQQEQTEHSVQAVRVDIAVLKRDVEAQSDKLREQGQDIKTILHILQKTEQE
jgi:peptidoglycan hydrolase CwlO-like protein